MFFHIPVKTTGDLNRPAASWRGRMGQAARAKLQLAIAQNCTIKHLPAVKLPRYRITLTRVCPARNQLRGSDNLQASLKHVRDGIAMAIRGGKPGQKDDTDEWVYAQEGVKNGKSYAVNVTLEGIG